ncbi:lectin subunit alpha-like [Musca vetustissima]|uniref:lectin subunit alpha-like n=1 Tax=Musca vetustissima TaxID=27455 RepID=UPI002AB768C6|nr:lectin subunit alpha-like [Musca vetustissima]
MNIPRSLAVFIFLIIGIINFTRAVPQWYNGTDGKRYLIEGEQKYNWFQAFHECARRNLQLVEIDSDHKNNQIISVLKPIFGNSHNLWIGAIDEYNGEKNYNRPFYWHSSGKRMTFSYWSDSNPDNDAHSEHCVHMWESKPNYRWNDHKCDWPRLGYICEDHHLQTECTECSEEKIQKITRAAGAVLEEYQTQQEAQIESLQKTLEKLEHEELRFKENLNSLLTKIELETSKLLVTYRVQMNSILDERSETLHSVNLGLRSDIEMLTKKFSRKLENVKTDYRHILKA